MIKYRKNQRQSRRRPEPFQFSAGEKNQSENLNIQLFQYNQEVCIEKIDLELDSIKLFLEDGNQYWLNIYGLNPPESIVSICQRQNISNMVIRDILDLSRRPKFQVFENYAFLVVRSTVPHTNDLESEQISFIISRNFVISFQERRADFFEHLRYRLRENKGIIRSRSSDFLLFTMLESILDNYFKTLDKIDLEVQDFNLANIRKDLSPEVLEMIELKKSLVGFIKKSVIPVKEFVLSLERNEYAFFEQSTMVYYQEIKDICLTLIDSCDTLLIELESSTNLFFSVQSHRMNQIMKTLTIVASVFIPLTFIAGVYGMNFETMPELTWRYGYLSVLGIMVFSGLAMLLYFKKKNWL